MFLFAAAGLTPRNREKNNRPVSSAAAGGVLFGGVQRGLVPGAIGLQARIPPCIAFFRAAWATALQLVMTDQQQPFPPFDPDAPHQQKPKIRPVRGFPASAGEQQVLGLADARQISDKIVFTHPLVQVLLPKMDGTRSLDQLVEEVGRGLTRPILEQLIAQLDDAALIEGPTFDTLWAKVRSDFDSSKTLPPGSTAAMADALAVEELGEEATDAQKAEVGPGKLKAALDKWIDASLKEAKDPSFDSLPKAIVVPHIDYPRGWMNYGAAWGRMRVTDRPDRIIILGTNHFGTAPGVCGCNKGFESPLGTCEADTKLVEALRESLGDALYEHRYDHEREHSIELQIPWIQHCIGADDEGNFPPIFAALVHDPVVNNGQAYDESGIGLDAFVEATKKALTELGGTTLVVSSADLSHVGPAFGDQHPLAGDKDEPKAFRERVLHHDREMIGLFAQRKPEELVASMAWQQNPTRWCSIGNMVAAMRIAEPDEVRILNYAAAMDQQGMGMVSSCAVAMF